MSRTDPGEVWAADVAVAKGDVIAWAREADSRGVFQVPAELEATEISAAGTDVRMVLMVGYSAAGDVPFPMPLRWRDTPAAHSACWQSADGAYWELVADWAVPEMFGAKGDVDFAADTGTNDAAALGRWIAYQKATGRTLALSPDRIYGTQAGLDLDYNHVHIAGAHVYSQANGPIPRSGLYKLTGFTGAALLRWSPATPTPGNPLNGLCVEHVTLIGGPRDAGGPVSDLSLRRAGDGLRLVCGGDVKLDAVHTLHHEDWGMVYDGIWVARRDNSRVSFNGTASAPGVAGGGGVLFQQTIYSGTLPNPTSPRANTQHTASGDFIVANRNRGVLAVDGGGANLQLNSAGFFGGSVEGTRDADGNGTTQVELQSPRNVGFYDVQMPGPATASAPGVIIGKDDAVEEVVGLRMVGVYVQHGSGIDDSAIELRNNVRSAEFVVPAAALTEGSKFLDASALGATNAQGNQPDVRVIGGGVAVNEIVDPNRVVVPIAAAEGKRDLFGRLWGGAGDTCYVGTYEQEPVAVTWRDASVRREVVFGAGTSGREVRIGTNVLAMQPLTAAPTGLSTGQWIEVVADRANWDPLSLGSGAAYKVATVDGGATWFRPDAQP